MPHYNTLPGVDLKKFIQVGLCGCYQNGKEYRTDYASYQLVKFQLLCREAARKRAALQNVNLDDIARKIDEIDQRNAKERPEYHQVGAYTPEDVARIEEIRKPLIEYRNALDRLYHCALKLDVDKNTGNRLGVLDYARFYDWRQSAFAELTQWERRAKSISGSDALRRDMNCIAYAADSHKHLNGAPMFTNLEMEEPFEIVSKMPAELAKEVRYNRDHYFGMSMDYSEEQRFSTSEEMRRHMLRVGVQALADEGFDVEAHPLITAENYGPKPDDLPPPKPGYRRAFLMCAISDDSKAGDLHVLELHWARQDGDGHWSDKPGQLKVRDEADGVNPTHMDLHWRLYGSPYEDQYTRTFGKLCRPLPSGWNTTEPWAKADASSNSPHMPIAYIDISDQNRYARKRKLLQNPLEYNKSQKQKLLFDIVRYDDPNHLPSAERNKLPRAQRYRALSELGWAFVQRGYNTPEELDKAAAILLQRQAPPKRSLQEMYQLLFQPMAFFPVSQTAPQPLPQTMPVTPAYCHPTTQGPSATLWKHGPNLLR